MPGREARVEAQAKLNLFLRVLEREDSGYHQVETLFCRIKLSDSITVRVTDSGRSIDCTGERMPAEGLGRAEKNLAWRAAVAYAEATGFPDGFAISIEKRIPVGGGLGGGSADAGAVLRALNALNPRDIDEHELLGIAATLGADVPFLTQSESTLALGTGYGEVLRALPPLPARPVWLVVPRVAVNTADAYRWLDESGRGVRSVTIPTEALASWPGVASIASNDFEEVVPGKLPVIGFLLRALRDPELAAVFGRDAVIQLSGSGSTVAVIAGERPHLDLGPPPLDTGIAVIETETSEFVEPVALTH
jgi:4-diphosphocytidyl-2-C-methyl-D-erythritol kinase